MNSSSFQNKDGQTIYAVNWMPEGEPRAVVMIVHGLGEYSGRYAHVAELLNAQGIAVYGHDHRGHGKSESMYGLRTYFDHFNQPVADLEQYFRQVKAEHPDLPLFIYGHSMGSLISLLFVLKHQAELAGWISSGTPLDLHQSVPGIMLASVNMLAKIAPKLPTIALKAEGVSRDEQVVSAYKNDPLVNHQPLRAGMLSNLVMTAKGTKEQLGTITLPVLLLHGSEDELTPVSGSKSLYDHVASPDKTLKIYPGLYHEVHNEPEKDQVLGDVLDWLQRHI